MIDKYGIMQVFVLLRHSRPDSPYVPTQIIEIFADLDEAEKALEKYSKNSGDYWDWELTQEEVTGLP